MQDQLIPLPARPVGRTDRRRRRAPHALLLLLLAGAAAAAPALPAVNLLIDLRQVDEVVHEEPARGRAAVVIGTGRSAELADGRQWSTRPQAEPVSELGQLRLRNGASGELQWVRKQSFEWVDQAWAPGTGRTGAAANPATQGVALQRQWLPTGRQIELTARWPGGKAPAELDVTLVTSTLDNLAGSTLPQAVGSRTAASVLVPLDQWVTLARSASRGDGGGLAGGNISTSAAGAAVPASLLQARVRVAAPAVPGR